MSRLKEFGRLVMGLLRELSDENAYQRHLTAEGREHSGNEQAVERDLIQHHLVTTSSVGHLLSQRAPPHVK